MVEAGSPGLLRRAAQRLLTHPWVLERAAARSAGHATIIMLHRFSEPGAGGTAFPTDILRSHLQWLRTHHYRLTGLDTLVQELREGRPIPPRTVTFTVDDGYADFSELAVPVFAEFDCPVTVFVVTDFLDGKCWLWWDQIECGILSTRKLSCTVSAPGSPRQFSWDGVPSRLAAARAITSLVKYLPAARRTGIIGRLLGDLDVALPAHPGREYAAMTWDALRAVTGTGVTVGPHTASHPILTMEDAETAEREIRGSWERLRAEVPAALPVFCYPNGDRRSYGAREVGAVERSGLEASVSTTPAYVAGRDYRPGQRFLREPLPRLSLESDFLRFAQVVSGVERLKAMLRG